MEIPKFIEKNKNLRFTHISGEAGPKSKEEVRAAVKRWTALAKNCHLNDITIEELLDRRR